MSIFDGYTNKASVSKTLRFKLIPTEHTKRHIEEYGVLNDDFVRADAYMEVKSILDDYHKKYIAEKLSALELDWSELYDAYCARKSDDKTYKFVQEKYRKQISEYLKSGKNLESAKLIKEKLKEQPNNEALKLFKGFTTYFKKYNANRDNMYAAKGQTSIAYRLIDDNFSRFARNAELFATLDGEFVCRMEKQLHDDGILDGDLRLSNLFCIDYYTHVLSQKGIINYNTVLGGVANDDNKLKGINEYCNLEFQQGRIKKTRFVTLHNQILSDKATRSFIPHAFENDGEVKAAIKEYSDALTAYDFSEIEYTFCGNIAASGIFVEKKQLEELSRKLFDNDWNAVNRFLQIYADGLGKSEKKKFLSKSAYSVQELRDCMEGSDILSAVWNRIKASVAKLKNDYAAIEPQLSGNGKIENFDGIKTALDNILDIEHALKFVATDCDERDVDFYDSFDGLYAVLRDGIKLYNKVRNYATKKSSAPEKIKLNFGSATLADGWDKNKECDNLAMIFIKDGKYYLGIRKKRKLCFERSDTENKSCYLKMEYKQITDPKKQFPQVSIGQLRQKSGKFLESKKYMPPKYIVDGYKSGKHKDGDNFDLKFCHDIIDYFKSVVERNQDWSVYNFNFSPTHTYNSLNDFYAEVAAQCYNVRLVPIDAEYVENLDRNGDLYLFEIYNKDFSEYSTGKKNLHTLYWQELFSERNLQTGNIKLGGEAELFHRPADSGNPFVHKKGDILIRKTNDNGTSVDPQSYADALRDARFGDIELCKRNHPELQFRYAPHDITKNKRYHEAQFGFHVPIKINSKAVGISRFNEEVLKTVSDSQCNIIGIDRGERNLLYVCVIDRDGNILYQNSLNKIANVDYNAKLSAASIARDKARKNWHEIQQIKDIKAGYLSAAVRVIVDLMLKYDAILVMENLNMGFKHGRVSIEKQIYQNFEKSLIEKLHYLTDKSKDPYEPGGIANGYQLSEQVKSFKDLKYQSGFVFYVPAAYTSKIDPKTGFVNLFSKIFPRDISMKSAREALSKFKSIIFNAAENRFEFTFDYADFGVKAGGVKEWTLGTCGDGRIDGHKDASGHFQQSVIEVTDEMKGLFDRYGVEYAHGDLRDKICAVTEKSFYDSLLYLLRVTVKLRYEDKDRDFILSPVVNFGKPFDSREQAEGLPKNGDANGAYHIALQGLRMLGNIENGEIKSDAEGESNNNWFAFAQEIARRKRER